MGWVIQRGAWGFLTGDSASSEGIAVDFRADFRQNLPEKTEIKNGRQRTPPKMRAILDGLKNNSRFPFNLLAAHYEDAAEYWSWWWTNRAQMSVLSRPYTIKDGDPILQPTIRKGSVDTETWREMFYPFSRVHLEKEVLPSGLALPRHEYRQAIVNHLVSHASEGSKKIIVFVGGGYGAGKTTTLSMLANHNQLPFDKRCLLGVDYCKLFIPEFDRIKAVADGRASEVCQEESRLISEQLFAAAIADSRSFAWDSSMSNCEETMKKITAAKAAGYELWLIGVWTPVEVSIPRAMERARYTRRFAHPDHLEPSTKGFARNFDHYFDQFDRVQLYANGDDSAEGEEPQPRLIAEKDPVDSVLAMDDAFTTQQFLKFGQQP